MTEATVNTTSIRRVLLRHRWLPGWLMADFASALGDQFLTVAFAVAAQYGAIAAGTVLACGAAPRILGSIVSGAVVDRMGMRRAMITADAVRTGALAATAAAMMGHGASVLLLAVAAGISSLFSALYEPAALGLAATAAPAEDLAGAYSARLTLQRIAILVGAPLAGWAIAVLGTPVGVLIDAATFAASLVIALRLPVGSALADAAQSTARGILRDTGAGYAYLWRTGGILLTLSRSPCSSSASPVLSTLVSP